MKCYSCKSSIKTSIRRFMFAQNKYEKDTYRDLCEDCYNHQMELAGYVLHGNCWERLGVSK